MAFADKTLTCRDCGTAFSFTSGEQEFHAQKGFTTAPVRCPDCRARRRSERGESTGGGGSSTGGASGGQRELFSARCGSCGKEAKVPFQPRGDRPVYCSDCFRSQQGNTSYTTATSSRDSAGSADRNLSGGGYGDSPQGPSGERGDRSGRRGRGDDRRNRW